MVRMLLSRRSTLIAITFLSKSVPTKAFGYLTSSSHPKPFIRSTVSQLRMSSSAAETKKRVLVPIANDSEEIETSCITDTLTRFGADVIVASVNPGGELVCKMSRGIKFLADIAIEDAKGQDWDLIALPGGMPGAEHLRDCEVLIDLLKEQKAKDKMYAAVCAAPSVVLSTKGLIDSGHTCYPAPPLLANMKDPADTEVVVQGNVVTSRGPGTALKFALQLGEMLYGTEKAEEIANQMLVAR